MAIRPIDLAQLMPRSTEVSRTEHVDARRPEVMHQQFSETLQKKVDQDQQQVVQTNKAEQDGVDKDGSNKNGQERKKNNSKKAAQDKNKTRKAHSTSMFDISV